MRPIKTTVILTIQLMHYMARTNLPTNFRIASCIHAIGYTQHCDVPLRWVQTLDFDFYASLAKDVGGFLPVMASVHALINQTLRYAHGESVCTHDKYLFSIPSLVHHVSN